MTLSDEKAWPALADELAWAKFQPKDAVLGYWWRCCGLHWKGDEDRLNQVVELYQDGCVRLEETPQLLINHFTG